jgi:hypothetical protein
MSANLNNRKRSNVWMYFSAIDENKAKCDLCKKVLSIRGGSVYICFYVALDIIMQCYHSEMFVCGERTDERVQNTLTDGLPVNGDRYHCDNRLMSMQQG